MKTLAQLPLGKRLLQIGILEDDDEELKRSFMTLRRSVWVQKYHWEDASPLGIEADNFDKHSEYLLISEGERAVGGCRIIYDRGIDLPIKWITVPLEESIIYGGVELSRFCLSTKHLDKRERAMALSQFISVTNGYLKSERIVHVYATVRYSLFLMLKRLGLPCRAIGPVHKAHENKFVPAVMETFEDAEVALQKQA